MVYLLGGQMSTDEGPSLNDNTLYLILNNKVHNRIKDKNNISLVFEINLRIMDQ